MAMQMNVLLTALRAAAEPTRLRLLVVCAHGEFTVGELTAILGQSQPSISRHLKLLCEASLLEKFREGTHAFFRLTRQPPHRGLAEFLVDCMPGEDQIIALDLERLEAIKNNRAIAAERYFQEVAPKWDHIRSLHIDEREVERALTGLMPQQRQGHMLDIGTGTGRLLELCAPFVERAIGIDMSRNMLAFARAKLEKTALKNVSVRLGDMYQLPFASESFDIITLHQVLHHADDPSAVIDEAARVLKPQGQLILVDFTPHKCEDLRTRLAHRNLGFHDSEIADWYQFAGLNLGQITHLPGKPLTVGIWPATRANAETAESAGNMPPRKDEEVD